MKTLIFILILFTLNPATSQLRQSTIDTVISYHWGDGQNSGQSDEYFPMNIFGKPDSAARSSFQSSDPKEICSLGLGGEITVAFKGFDITDGPGPDFTVFENAFINPINKKIFSEPAIISVSEDGITFYDFPFDSASLIGCAGITPTIGDKNCFNPNESGGDKFDLATIGLSRAKYIRIRDITQMLLDKPNHDYYDPILSGFDLDAVAGINLMMNETASVVENRPEIKQFSSYLLITVDGQFFVDVYSVNGILLNSYDFQNSGEVELYKTGIFFVLIKNCNGFLERKIIIN